MTGTLLLELDTPSDEKERQRYERRFALMRDWFNYFQVNFVPSNVLAAAFRGPVVLINSAGQVKPEDKAYEIGDIVRAHYSPSPKQTRVAIDFVPPQSGSRPQLKASGFSYHYLDMMKKEDPLHEQKSTMSLKERSFAAIIMVRHAQAMGWKTVNTHKTTDPAERYILEMACRNAGLTIAQPIEKSEVQKTHMFLFPPDEDGKEKDLCKSAFEMMAKDPLGRIMPPGTKVEPLERKTNVEPPKEPMPMAA